MGMELEFYGVRAITVDSTGAKETQRVDIDTWGHVPYLVCLAISKSSTPIDDYVQYLDKAGEVWQEPVYADDDWLEDQQPIGFTPRNYCAEHLVDFKVAIETYTKAGYTIHLEVL